MLRRSENPRPCFGREHGRNKGEFNSFDGRLGLILPMSLMFQQPCKPAFRERSAQCACKKRWHIRKAGIQNPPGPGSIAPFGNAMRGANWTCPRGRYDCPRVPEMRPAGHRAKRRPDHWRCPTGRMAVAAELDLSSAAEVDCPARYPTAGP